MRSFAGSAPLVQMMRHGALRTGLHLEKRQKIGLFGGSFNPAHEGHRHVAETARVRLGLDKIIWLVSPQNPLKSKLETAPLADRMAEILPFVGPDDIISDFETRISATYTIDTLSALKARFKGVQFVWIMGADSLASFHRWRGWLQIARLMPMAIVSRPGSLMNARFSPAAQRFRRYKVPSHAAKTLSRRIAPAWVFLKGPLHKHSSTQIRAQRQKVLLKPKVLV